jgi:hypothetical protein
VVRGEAGIAKTDSTEAPRRTGSWSGWPSAAVYHAGHVVGVEVGAVQTGSWYDLPSGETIRVQGARLTLPLDNPADDVATAGDPALFQAK